MSHLKIFHYWKIFQNLQCSLYKINSEKKSGSVTSESLEAMKGIAHSF